MNGFMTKAGKKREGERKRKIPIFILMAFNVPTNSIRTHSQWENSSVKLNFSFYCAF